MLNARYLEHLLGERYDLPYPSTCMHEFVTSAKTIKKDTGVRAMDIAKALMDGGYHAPTVYFPLIVEEALMIEPTETQSRETIENLAATLVEIAERAYEDADAVKEAPLRTPVHRPDDARAARDLHVTWSTKEED